MIRILAATSRLLNAKPGLIVPEAGSEVKFGGVRREPGRGGGLHPTLGAGKTERLLILQAVRLLEILGIPARRRGHLAAGEGVDLAIRRVLDRLVQLPALLFIPYEIGIRWLGSSSQPAVLPV